jgi:hypothetical protein
VGDFLPVTACCVLEHERQPLAGERLALAERDTLRFRRGLEKTTPPHRCDRLHQLPDHVLDPAGRRLVAVGELGFQLVQRPVLDRAEQPGLALEAPVDGADRHAGPLRDRGHGQVLDPLGREQLLRRFEDLPGCPLAAGLLRLFRQPDRHPGQPVRRRPGKTVRAHQGPGVVRYA